MRLYTRCNSVRLQTPTCALDLVQAEYILDMFLYHSKQAQSILRLI
jgi:hypothetical protein